MTLMHSDVYTRLSSFSSWLLL